MAEEPKRVTVAELRPPRPAVTYPAVMGTLEHLPFPKISSGGTASASRDDWVASEKIHGAQLVVGANADEVRTGKRKAWLAPDEPFFGWQMLRPLLNDAARAIQRNLDPTGVVWLYGELFGGSYPEPSVTPVAGLVPVQTGIWYAPDLHYAVFDMVHQASGAEPVFLSDAQTRALAEAAGITTVPLIAKGRYSDLDRLPVRFPTLIPALWGLPSIPNNYAEGYVLKYAQQTSVDERPVTKRKIPEFCEQRFDESNAFDANTHLEFEALSALAKNLMNAARVASARSKVGEHPERVNEEAVLDALIDLRDMLPRQFDTMSAEDEQRLQHQLDSRAREVVAG
ncbi:MAG TPA: RNA ligase family protein [Polyangiaceae bacterium]|nr:RNA ligase family protein [Polyangiaceae bacterium]